MDAKHLLGEPHVLISRDALLHNATLLHRALERTALRSAGAEGAVSGNPAVGNKPRICAIVKANAYGHGVEHVIDTLYNFSTGELEGPLVDMLAVASIDEAEALPGTSLPVVIFRPVENSFMGRQRGRIELAVRNGWVLTLCSAAGADDVARIAMSIGRRAAVQIMLDTGMTRSGVPLAGFEHLLNTVVAHSSLKLAGVCTHFANADDPDSDFTPEQIARFRGATDGPLGPGGKWAGKVMRHAANSGGLFFHPEAHFDAVRPGISLFGIDPTGRPCADRPLRPVLKWTAPLVCVKDVKQGATVGYGRTWVAPRDTRIGLLPIGYADGYLRSFGNRAMMLVHGSAVPVVGVVSMDSVTVDLGRVPQANVGDEVTVLDDDPLSPASVYALAKLADTIPYEIFCRIGPRIPRVSAEVEAEIEEIGDNKGE